MAKFIHSFVKMMIMRYKCAKSIRNVKISIKKHVNNVDSISICFNKVKTSYDNILKSLDSSAMMLEEMERELVMLYDKNWNTKVRESLSNQILIIRDNKNYMIGLRKEMFEANS